MCIFASEIKTKEGETHRNNCMLIMENNMGCDIKYYTIGYNKGVKYNTEREAINAMNANPNQKLVDIFGYNVEDKAILEIEMNVVGDRFMVFGGFRI